MDWDQQKRSQPIFTPATQFSGPSQPHSQYAGDDHLNVGSWPRHFAPKQATSSKGLDVRPRHGHYQQSYERWGPPASYARRLPSSSTFPWSEPPRNLPSSPLPPHIRPDRHCTRSAMPVPISQRGQYMYASPSAYMRMSTISPYTQMPSRIMPLSKFDRLGPPLAKGAHRGNGPSTRNKAGKPTYGRVPGGHPPYHSGSTSPKLVTTIKSTMQISEVMQHLVEHGCPDITGNIDFGSLSMPIAWGGSGCVYMMKLRDGTDVAVKCLSILGSLDISDKRLKILKHIAQEIYVWSRCDHPSILQLQGMASFGGQVAIVSPWMRNGNLGSFLRKQPSFDRIQLCLQLAEGLKYMHTVEIVHGDIKPANVVMSDDNIPLFTDFGNALLTSEATLQFTATTSLGLTTRFAAPEILKGESRYSAEGDVYAFGMMILEVVTGEVPFGGRSSASIICAVITERAIPSRPDLSYLLHNKMLEDEFWTLLTRCWAYEPESRPSVTEVSEQLASIQRRLITV